MSNFEVVPKQKLGIAIYTIFILTALGKIFVIATAVQKKENISFKTVYKFNILSKVKTMDTFQRISEKK